ncbi:MAG: M3 family oligoendopeptidase [Chloroflexi bacterium]|nr:M3 family oligoendopeptidase [Chloroflexota bacterium]MBK6711255.1 M3 family oligoendopeptidase [Chloroflexota bacterium]MBK7176259.1 M3 family oligoendopeptidase [Chloroflexota bacterium]MBK8931154.1 M3 family oligoendopeptidase [Chloroflexota bacterium]MBP7592464.1 M3 family oligoendopeptidase [Chloroflexota bacterium]
MNFPLLPTTLNDTIVTDWQAFAPYFAALQTAEITPTDIDEWLLYWSDLRRLVGEALATLSIQKTIDTTDVAKEQAYLDFIENVLPQVMVADQVLKQRLLALALEDRDDLALILRAMRNEADLFRDENVPLQTRLAKLDNDYDKVTGGLKTDWNGEPHNLSQLGQYQMDKDRQVRERAWNMTMDLWLSQREMLNKLYADMLELRQQVAENADVPDYRAYVFREYGRFDYTPDDCLIFHQAIETAVVPAALRIYEKKRTRLGLSQLRPWDILVDTNDQPSLKPYQGQDQLIQGALNILNQVDVALGRYFAVMAEENLLDLQTRPGKALGGYCATLPKQKRPFIFMNGVGLHDDVQTLLHEAGHAFHVFETANIPLIWQTDAPMEFCEVASMSMELLAAPYLTRDFGGFYTPVEAARARIEHLEGIITFLPYMAVVDAFQHWVYTHPREAASSDNCDNAWNNLWVRFMPGVDWTGYENVQMSGWHRKLHIFGVPFYYVEYGMAQVGALQVWRNARQDQAQAVAAYRQALALGSTKTLPELFAAAGAEFRFDTAMLTDLVNLIETTVEELETVAGITAA